MRHKNVTHLHPLGKIVVMTHLSANLTKELLIWGMIKYIYNFKVLSLLFLLNKIVDCIRAKKLLSDVNIIWISFLNSQKRMSLYDLFRCIIKIINMYKFVSENKFINITLSDSFSFFSIIVPETRTLAQFKIL